MKYELIIFDFDGTIADTSPGIFNSIRHSITTLGLKSIPEQQMQSFIGPPLSHAYNSNFGFEGAQLERAMQLHKEYGVLNGYREIRFYNGIFPLLEQLKANGAINAIATLKLQPTLNRIVDEFGCAEYFRICKGVDIDAPMTKTDILNYCMKQAGNISRDHTVLIGDSSYDAIGAYEAGIDFIAVTYGFGFMPDEIIDYPHVAVCNSANEIKDFLCN